jgi:hypothetical protein
MFLTSVQHPLYVEPGSSKMKNKKTPHRRDSSKIQSIIVDRGKIDSRRQRQNR